MISSDAYTSDGNVTEVRVESPLLVICANLGCSKPRCTTLHQVGGPFKPFFGFEWTTYLAAIRHASILSPDRESRSLPNRELTRQSTGNQKYLRRIYIRTSITPP